jgi:hypothetical protein
MEEKFVAAWTEARSAALALGVRMRPIPDAEAMKQAHRCLSGHKESDGFWPLCDKGRADLTLEALAVKKQFTALFSDEEANTALNRLLSAGHF